MQALEKEFNDSFYDLLVNKLLNQLFVVKISLELELDERGEDVNLRMALKNTNKAIGVIKEITSLNSE